MGKLTLRVSMDVICAVKSAKKTKSTEHICVTRWEVQLSFQ